jgi:hypothetical protein
MRGAAALLGSPIGMSSGIEDHFFAARLAWRAVLFVA